MLMVGSRRLQVQTIGLFAHLRSMNIHGPFMVIGPLSTLSNWVGEVQRWCPDMPVLLYHGTQAERQALRAKRMAQGGARSTPALAALHTAVSVMTRMLRLERIAGPTGHG